VSERSLRRGNWSVQELERLRQLLPRRGVVATALLLRRSAVSVLKKALEKLKVPPRRGPWTRSDDERLRESWGAVEPRLLGPMLGRPPADVVRRATELRRQLRSGPWDRAETQLLKDLYGTRHDGDLEVALLRPRLEIATMAAQLCLAKDKRFAAQAEVKAVAEPSPATPTGRRSMPRWKPAEIARLIELYADCDNLEVARQVGRTVTSVANKANQLGLKKSPQLLAAIGRTNVALRYGRPGEPAPAAGEAAAEATS
jgi:hypothetical protein